MKDLKKVFVSFDFLKFVTVIQNDAYFWLELYETNLLTPTDKLTCLLLAGADDDPDHHDDDSFSDTSCSDEDGFLENGRSRESPL